MAPSGFYGGIGRISAGRPRSLESASWRVKATRCSLCAVRRRFGQPSSGSSVASGDPQDVAGPAVVDPARQHEQVVRQPVHVFHRFRIDRLCLGERSEEHTSELQSLMRISYAVFCLKKKKTTTNISKE